MGRCKTDDRGVLRLHGWHLETWTDLMRGFMNKCVV